MRLVLAFFVGMAVVGAFMINTGFGLIVTALVILSVIGDW